MYIINIAVDVAKTGKEHLNALMVEHRDWFLAEFEKGNFLLVGPYLDWPAAGIIMAKDMPRPALDDILARDVFYKDALASYDVHEFKAAQVRPEIVMN